MSLPSERVQGKNFFFYSTYQKCKISFAATSLMIARLSKILAMDFGNVVIFHPRVIVIVLILVPLVTVMQINGIYHVWPNVLGTAQSLIGFPFLLHVLARVYNRFVVHSENILNEIQIKLFQFYKVHECNLKYRKILLEKSAICHQIVKTYMISCGICYFMPVLSTIVNAILTSQLKLMAPVFIPYLDHEELLGFVVNTIFFIPITFFLYLSIGIGEFLIIFFGYQGVPMIDLMCLKMDELEESLEIFEAEKCKKIDPILTQMPSTSKWMAVQAIKNAQTAKEMTQKVERARIEQKLIGIINDYCFYTNFFESILAAIQWPSFLRFSANSYALCICVLTLLTSSKLIGLSLFILFLLQIAIDCVIGTRIEMQNERFLNKLCGFPWYHLSKPKQMIFLQFIHLCQNGIEFGLPMIKKVDMELFSTILKGAYSFFMYLWTFVKI